MIHFICRGFDIRRRTSYYVGGRRFVSRRASEARPYAYIKNAQKACVNLNRRAAHHGMWFEAVQIEQGKTDFNLYVARAARHD